jgi:hypothetical protein
MGTAMPLENLARTSTAPALVNQTVDLVHVEATHLRRPPLAPDDAGGVLLPVDDVSKRVLHGPGIPGRGAGNASAPVSWTELRHEAVELGKLAPRPVENLLSSMPHGPSSAVALTFQIVA